MSNLQLAKSLGWASLAIGAIEIIATRWLEEEIGVGEHRTLIRSFGLREIAAGATILSQPGLNRTLASGLWARVAGDAVELAMLGAAASSTRRPTGLAAVFGLVLAITGLDVVVASRVQADLHHAAAVSAEARKRVTPTSAVPEKIMSSV